MSAPQWEVYLDGVREPKLVHAYVNDVSNPFGTFAEATIYDREETRFDAYSIFDPITFTVYPDGLDDPLIVESGETHTVDTNDTETYGWAEVEGTLEVAGTLEVGYESKNERFEGYVADRHEQEEQGTDKFVVEAHTYDQFLRGEKIDEDLTGSTIFEALETIVTGYTPVTWEPTNVEVGDNQELTQSFSSEKVETALLALSFKSVSEEFGVNSDLEFFFRPIESQSAPSDLGTGDVINVEVEEDGRAAPNECTVWFDGGDRSVTVSLSPDKLDRQDAVGSARPVTNAVEITREGITDISDAEDAGRRYLEQQQGRFLGNVTARDLYAASIGDVISVRAATYDLDSDYRIAGLEYEDSFETIVSIVDQRREQDQRLVNFGDTLDRVEQRPANRDAIRNEVLDTQATAQFNVGAMVAGTTFDRSRFVNTARQKARDAWRDGDNDPLDITHIAVGDDPSNLGRTNTALENETDRVAVSESLDGDFGVSYSNAASVTESNIREVGLFDGDGDLVCRLVRDTDGVSGTLAVSITIENDASISKGVLTNTGRESVRDIVADNGPALPTQYAYGSDGTEPALTDSALGNQLVALDLNDVLLQSDISDADFADIIDPEIADTDPLEVSNNELKALQTAIPVEGEDWDRQQNHTTVSNSSFSDGFSLSGSNTDLPLVIEWDVRFDYDVPAEHVAIQTRDEINEADPTIDSEDNVWTFNNVEINGVSGSNISLDWHDPSGFWGPADDYGESGGEDLQAGETYTLKFEADQSSLYRPYHIDVVCVYDDRFNHDAAGTGNDFDNTVHQNDGYLGDPQLSPPLQTVAFQTVSTRRDLTELNVSSTWNDTTNEQFIELRIGNDSFDRTNNTETASTTHSGSGERSADVQIGISRYPENTNAQSATPRFGYNQQAIQEYELRGNPAAITSSDIGTVDIRAIVPPGALDGDTIRESGALTSSDNALTRSVLADLAVGANQRIISSESNTFENE